MLDNKNRELKNKVTVRYRLVYENYPRSITERPTIKTFFNQVRMLERLIFLIELNPSLIYYIETIISNGPHINNDNTELEIEDENV